MNLTPHSLIIRREGQDTDIPPAGAVPRVHEHVLAIRRDDGIEIADVRLVGLAELPPPEPGVWLIASLQTAIAAAQQGRTDVLTPDTSPSSAVRDDGGRIVAVQRLRRIVP